MFPLNGDNADAHVDGEVDETKEGRLTWGLATNVMGA